MPLRGTEYLRSGVYPNSDGTATTTFSTHTRGGAGWGGGDSHEAISEALDDGQEVAVARVLHEALQHLHLVSHLPRQRGVVSLALDTPPKAEGRGQSGVGPEIFYRRQG